MRRAAFTIPGLAFALVLTSTAFAQRAPFSPAELAERTIHRRAVEAVNWGIPAVNTDRMYAAMRRYTLLELGSAVLDVVVTRGGLVRILGTTRLRRNFSQPYIVPMFL